MNEPKENLSDAQSERIRAVISELGMSLSDFFRSAGIAQGYMSQKNLKKSLMTNGTAQRFKFYIPNLNIDWLRYGIGEKSTDGLPLRSRKGDVNINASLINSSMSNSVISDDSEGVIASLTSQIASLTEQNKLLRLQIDDLRNMLHFMMKDERQAE